MPELVSPHSGAAQLERHQADEDRWRRLKEQGKEGLVEHGSHAASTKEHAIARANQTTAPRKQRVALLFFGVPGPLLYTLKSVQQSVVRTIEEAGYQAAVFAHSFDNDSFVGGYWRPLEMFQHTVTSPASFLKGTRCVRVCSSEPPVSMTPLHASMSPAVMCLTLLLID